MQQISNNLPLEDFWWLERTCNPDNTKNETINIISNIYCLADFRKININDVEEYLGIERGTFKKILDNTIEEWNNDHLPVSKQNLPIINNSIVEAASEFFTVTEETLRNETFSLNFYYYTYGKPTSINIEEANKENMTLILFIEKMNLDCRNNAFNITSFQDGGENHIGARYDITYVNNSNFKFKIHKNEAGEIMIIVGSGIMDKLIFGPKDIVYPIANRMENVIYEAAVRDSKCKKVATIPNSLLTVMDDFITDSRKEDSFDKTNEDNDFNEFGESNRRSLKNDDHYKRIF